jgi:hypothetical protein
LLGSSKKFFQEGIYLQTLGLNLDNIQEEEGFLCLKICGKAEI